jgi:hypothetical protein
MGPNSCLYFKSSLPNENGHSPGWIFVEAAGWWSLLCSYLAIMFVSISVMADLLIVHPQMALETRSEPLEDRQTQSQRELLRDNIEMP